MTILIYVSSITYFYPRSPCGERHFKEVKEPEQLRISIHALLAESDFHCFLLSVAQAQFLSTLSLRRATLPCLSSWDRLTNFYPRSPCGERRVFADGFRNGDTISIHALLAESDP